MARVHCHHAALVEDIFAEMLHKQMAFDAYGGRQLSTHPHVVLHERREVVGHEIKATLVDFFKVDVRRLVQIVEVDVDEGVAICAAVLMQQAHGVSNLMHHDVRLDIVSIANCMRMGSLAFRVA